MYNFLFGTYTPDDNGIYGGIIYANRASAEALDVGGSDWEDESWKGYVEELEKTLRARIKSGTKAKAIAQELYFEGDEDAEDELKKVMKEYRADRDIGMLDLDHLVELITQDESIDSTDWSYEADGYVLGYNGNDNEVIVYKSPFVAYVPYAMCFTGGYLEASSRSSIWCYCLGEDFFDKYSPIPYIPVGTANWLAMSDEQIEEAADAACEFVQKEPARWQAN